jgi:hypothetical protein
VLCADWVSIMTAFCTFCLYEDFSSALLCGNVFVVNGIGNATTVTFFFRNCLSEYYSTSVMALILPQDSGVGCYRLYMKLETFPEYYKWKQQHRIKG